MILYRPVGLQELALIYDSGMKSFPARLPQQPIFYPVLDLAYARQTASSWNAKNGQLAGYVTQFKLDDKYAKKLELHNVGKSQHQELWIPAEEMEKFNQHIQGSIKVVEAHFGGTFEGFVPDQFGLKGRNAVKQFDELANTYLYKRMDFYLEIKRNHKAVFLNYPFWQVHAFKNPGLKEKILQAIREAWLASFPQNPLPLPPSAEQEPEHPPPPAAPAPKDESPSRTSAAYEEIRRTSARLRAKRFVDPQEPEPPPDEESESDSWDEPKEEAPPPVQRENAPAAVQPEEEVFPSIEEEIAAAEDEDTPGDEEKDNAWDEEEEGDSYEPTPPAPEASAPETRARPRHWLNAVPEEFTPLKPPSPRKFGAPEDQTFRPIEQGAGPDSLEEYPEIIDELSRAIEDDPGDVVAHTSLGVALHRLGQEERAVACYESALRLDPKYAEAHYFRANILYEHGDVREAIKGYTAAIGLQPELISAHERPAPEDRLTDYNPIPAGMRWIAQPARRILELNGALAANPRSAGLLKQRAAAWSRLWNYEQAIADYSAALMLQPDDASALHARGVAYEQLGQPQRAQEDYRRASAMQSQLSNVYIQRGVAFANVGNLRQAIASLTEGIRLAPQNADAYFNRGASYFQLGDFDRAIEDFSSVIRFSPKDDGAFYWRGLSHEQAGRQREAIADYRQFLALSQDPQVRAEVEGKLSQWHALQREEAGSRQAAPHGTPRPSPAPPTKPDRPPDLHDLLTALGERARHSTWFGRGLQCEGEKAEELYALTEGDQPVEGGILLAVTAGIRKTAAGDLQAFHAASADAPWIFIRAWEGTGFYIETNDPRVKRQLKARFPSAEDVDGASPSYEGMFLRR